MFEDVMRHHVVERLLLRLVRLGEKDLAPFRLPF